MTRIGIATMCLALGLFALTGCKKEAKAPAKETPAKAEGDKAAPAKAAEGEKAATDKAEPAKAAEAEGSARKFRANPGADGKKKWFTQAQFEARIAYSYGRPG